MSSAPNPTPPVDGQSCDVIIRQEEGCAPVEYRLVRTLGHGAFGVVWLARKDDMVVALKILKGTANSEEAEREMKALLALEGLHHPFLLQTHGHWIDGDRLIIEMEFADGGSLKDRLKRFKAAGFTGMPVSELLRYFDEAAEALDYLHERKSFHRDIKPGNILVVNGCAKLADFGLLRQVVGDKSHTHTTGGTHAYMSPESIVE